MKRFYYLSVFALVAGLMSMFSVNVDANPKKVINSGNATAKGGNGGNANGTGATGGNGGGAVAVSGGVTTGSKKGSGTVANSGNATATGGNGGNANGKGAKGGNGGDAIAVSGNGNTVINGNGNTVIGKQVNNNISVNIGGGGGFGGGFVTGGAFASGGFGGDGVIVGQPGAAVAVTPAATVVTTDGTPAVAVGQDGKDSPEGEKEEVFNRRFLKVKNDSGVAMKVYVQFRGQEEKKWSWMPADPEKSKDALVYDLKAGEEMYLMHKDAKIAASRVRVWGMADEQSWVDFRDQDLWVVPEMDQRGEHRYIATDMKTFTFVFPKQMVK